MRRLQRFPLAAALLVLASHGAGASTVYGDLNNFDAVNDTGRECRGFQIEIVGARSVDITYTYDWNHYGPPRITEDLSSATPRVFIRYESKKDASGAWVADARTDVPMQPLAPTDGHFCTNPADYVHGCEHFGVGYYGAPAAIKYNWLHADASGNLVLGPAVNIGTPNFAYIPPVVDPALPPAPAQVVAVIPAPVVPVPAAKRFGEPSWVKVIKTKTHNAGIVALGDLVSDVDANGLPMWQNNEPAEVETEWRLLQTNDAGNAAKAEVAGQPDLMDNGNEAVTRRYEFYKYAGGLETIDAETGEAMCDEVAGDNLHGLRSNVGVTDAHGITQTVDCTAQVVIGDYLGAQMAGFDAEAPLGLVDNLQDGEVAVDYTPRTVVVGGDSPFTINIGGSLPPGLAIDTVDGVLWGIPTSGGSFSFTVEAIDSVGTAVNKAYTMKIAGGVVVQHRLAVGKSGSGTGSVTGNGVDCGATCAVSLDEGTAVVLTATPAAGSVFTGWSGACIGTGPCTTTMSVDRAVTATFTAQRQLVVSKAGSGSGGVTGSGINCGATCSVILLDGAAVALTATPAAGSVFAGWSGACGGTGSCTTTMTADKAVTATFAPAPQQYTLTVARTGLGTVTSLPKGITCGTQCAKAFPTGTSVKLTAKPASKHKFLGWSGDVCSGTALTCTVPMVRNQNVQALFN